MCGAGQEGIIAKKADAPYSGRRTMNWLKIKCTLRQEFVIVGWTTSKAKGRPFASFVLAQNSADGWRYAGRVGTGFGADVLEDLGKKMAPLAQNTSALDVQRDNIGTATCRKREGQYV